MKITEMEVDGDQGIMVLDPGGTTGWSEWGMERDGLVAWRGGQIPGGADGFNAWLTERYPWPDVEDVRHVIIEGMEQDATTGFAAIHDAFYIIGAVKLWAFQRGISVEIQRRSQKALVDDDVLRRAGLWKPGQRHEMDTFRHALAWAFAQDHQPTIAAFWPDSHWDES